MGIVRHRRAGRELRDALRLEQPARRDQDPQPRQAADADRRMDARGFQQAELLRSHPARPDRPHLLSRADPVGAADPAAARAGLDGAEPYPQHRGVRVHRAAGAREADVRTMGDGGRHRRPLRGTPLPPRRHDAGCRRDGDRGVGDDDDFRRAA
ncbi:hypothetical protein chiPu_0032228 [Chiloscyllium punctatum]|uniref:Uncharacterized protein n=1 Tax=Chiloscyllium punctatum TaxID=137246 RepID=A0A401U0A7_CHIPU|nr:hypothetical protein [Chiloscyllium punctatum]